MPPLKVQPDEQTARTNRAAVNQAEARFEFLVVIIEPARADIAAVKLERVAQLDVDRARDRVAGAACRRRADAFDPVDQFGGDAVEEEAAILAVARDALAVDPAPGVTRRPAAQPSTGHFADVGTDRERRGEGKSVASGWAIGG